MSAEVAQLSSPFASGGGGHRFENEVQTAFVILMLTGGAVPCLEPWPIRKIKLQGKWEGYCTDDFIAFVEERGGGRKAKLLAQIKHSVSVSDRDDTFAGVVSAAWRDFRNKALFDPNTDAIALITGPLSAQDVENVRTILEWARHSESAQKFIDQVGLAQFSSEAKRKKLHAFRVQLRQANNDMELADEELWRFLRCFHLLGYDLDRRSSVTLSLLMSHIAQFNQVDITGLWAKVAKVVEAFNQDAGTITIETLPQEIVRAFTEGVAPSQIPTGLLRQNASVPLGVTSQDLEVDMANALVLASLLGSWNEKVDGDREVIRALVESDD